MSGADVAMEKSEGFVYILVNPYVPDLVKIGFTNRTPWDRAEELSAYTGVPGNWKVHDSWYVENPDHWERHVFATLAHARETGEFFRLKPEEAVSAVVSALQSGGAVGPDGVSKLFRDRQRLVDKGLLSQAERERRRLELAAKQEQEQRLLDAAYAAGKEEYIRPWCDSVAECAKCMVGYRPQGAVGRFLNGPVELFPHIQGWRHYRTVLQCLPRLFLLSRQARGFMYRIGSRYPRKLKDEVYFGMPTGFDDSYPCGKSASATSARLSLMSTWRNAPPTSDDYESEIVEVVKTAFRDLNSDDAYRLLRAETVMHHKLLVLARANLPPGFK
jgi:hypothetical protein